MKPWKVLSDTTLLSREWIRIRQQRVETENGTIIDEYHLIDAVDWACIVCITDSDHVVLVRQYRHGIGRESLELPAGALDAGESPLAAAKRELLEETGYSAEHWTCLRSVSPETCRHTHQAHLFLATGASRVSGQSLDPTECVSVELRPVTDDLPKHLSHAVHIAAWLLACSRFKQL